MSYLDPAVKTSVPGTPAHVSPQAGISYSTLAAADPTGKMLAGSVAIVALPAANYTSVPASCTFASQYLTACALDISLIAISGGTSPSVTFLFERLAADGNWYPILPVPGAGVTTDCTFTSAQVPAQISIDIGIMPQNLPNHGVTPFYGSVHNVFTYQSRVRWTTTGSPTSVRMSMSIAGS